MIAIRACEGMDELEACVQLQIETWGYDPGDLHPRKLYRVAQRIGGQVFGAFDSEICAEPEPKSASEPKSLIGFAMALPGVKTGNGVPVAYLHSHMLAVRASYRNRGIGAQLKQAQRLDALSRGIRTMEWTFDPMEIKNAYLNLCKLGATACEYIEDFYGISSSKLHGGLPTDRLVAHWQLDSPRVQAILDGHTPPQYAVCEEILVPAAISQWKAEEASRQQALATQAEMRRRFQQAFSQGLAVVGFRRDTQGNGVFALGSLAHQELDWKKSGEKFS